MKKDKYDNYTYCQQFTATGLVDVEEKKDEAVVEPEEEIDDRPLWSYEGAVKRFDKVVISYFKAMTRAKSEKQAANNFRWQAKNKLGLNNVGGIKLTGSIKLEP